jgi:Flp pilus assembly pilin Flp
LLVNAGCWPKQPGGLVWKGNVKMKFKKASRHVNGFLGDETAQDLVEYSLLLAAIALAGTAAFLGMSSSANVLWSAANNNLAAGNSGS